MQQTAGGTRRVTVSGEVDLVNAAALEELLVDACRSGEARVVVDLSDVAFIDATGLRAIVAGQRAATRVGIPFCVRAGSPSVDLLLARVAAAELFDELRD